MVEHGTAMTTPHTEQRVGDGPWNVCLWCEKQPAILTGLDRWPVVGDGFEVEGAMWWVVGCRTSPSQSGLGAELTFEQTE